MAEPQHRRFSGRVRRTWHRSPLREDDGFRPRARMSRQASAELWPDAELVCSSDDDSCHARATTISDVRAAGAKMGCQDITGQFSPISCRRGGKMLLSFLAAAACYPHAFTIAA
ncbi:Uncharacterized protein ToN1_19880 [Aromatoleum petrolei]|nr:Uncharacterized protein ToN1_19880 [Aromatoleum petrolei]